MKTIKQESQEKMQKSLDNLIKEYAAIRAGRANPAVLDKVMVDYYGAPTPIQQVGTVSVTEGRTLVIQPWDKTLLKAVEKAIQTSEIGINPTNDGNVIRITFPQPTEERRKELCKQVSKMGEECRVAVRSVRRDGNDKYKALKKAGECTEDDLKDAEESMQKLTDEFIKKVDEAVKAKEQEIMSL